MARRPQAADEAINLGPLVLVALGAGALWWLLPKVFPQALAQTPGTGLNFGPSLPSSGGSSHPLASLLNSARRRSVDAHLVSLLSESATARKAYLFQAGMYSFFQTNAVPDGKNGPVTRALAEKEARALGTSNSFTTVNDTVLLNLGNALRVLTGFDDLSQARVRIVPGALPQALINQINSEGLGIAADVPLLQIAAG